MAEAVADVVVEFTAGSSLLAERDRPSDLRILGNGPPGTFVILRNVRISLPTDQIVAASDAGGTVSVGFGGMAFTGVNDGHLTFRRVRDLWPEERLSPDRSWTMTLDPAWIATVRQDGRLVWPAAVAERAGLCASCAHARVVTSSRGAAFLLCQLAAGDKRFPRYPRLPVARCDGYQAAARSR